MIKHREYPEQFQSQNFPQKIETFAKFLTSMESSQSSAKRKLRKCYSHFSSIHRKNHSLICNNLILYCQPPANDTPKGWLQNKKSRDQKQESQKENKENEYGLVQICGRLAEKGQKTCFSPANSKSVTPLSFQQKDKQNHKSSIELCSKIDKCGKITVKKGRNFLKIQNTNREAYNQTKIQQMRALTEYYSSQANQYKQKYEQSQKRISNLQKECLQQKKKQQRIKNIYEKRINSFQTGKQAPIAHLYTYPETKTIIPDQIILESSVEEVSLPNASSKQTP